MSYWVRVSCLVVIAGLALLGFCADTALATTYEMTGFGCPDGCQIFGAVAINNSGQVAGNAWGYDCGYQAWVWQGGSFTNKLLYAWQVTSLDNAGQVISGYPTTSLSAIDGSRYQALSFAPSAINNNNQIVGNYSYSGGNRFFSTACMWSGGVRSDLAYGNSQAVDINDTEQIAGWTVSISYSWNSSSTDLYTPWIWQSGTITNLPSLSSGLTHNGNVGGSLTTAINASGDIVGYSYDYSGRSHACLWHDGVITDLGLLCPCLDNSAAMDINSAGQIAGYYFDSSGNQHACIWQDGAMIDLGYGSALAINDRGQIIGSDRIWQPVPEPASFLSIILGTSFIGFAKRRGRRARLADRSR